MSMCHRRRSGVGIAFGVNDRVECHHGCRAEGRALGDRQSEIRRVTFGCNLDIVFLWIRLQISEIKASYITIHKIYFIFWNPFKFRGLVRSHVLHALKNAHGLLEMCVQVKVMVTLRVRMLLMVRVRRSLSV